MAIVGGQGALASSVFHQRLVEAFQHKGARADEEYPLIVHLSQALPGFSEKGVTCAATALDALKNRLMQLRAFSPDVYVLPCNSLEQFRKELAASVDVPVLTPVSSVPAEWGHGKKVGVLTSESLRNTQLYDVAMGAPAVYVPLNEQYRINRIIEMVIGSGDRERISEECISLIDYLFTFKVSNVVLGCTELSCIPRLRENPEVTDAMDWLVQATINCVQ